MIHPTERIGLPRIAAHLAGKGIAAAWRWSLRNWDTLLVHTAMLCSVGACLFSMGAIG